MGGTCGLRLFPVYLVRASSLAVADSSLQVRKKTEAAVFALNWNLTRGRDQSIASSIVYFVMVAR